MREQEKNKLIISVRESFPAGVTSTNLLGNKRFIDWLLRVTPIFKESDFWEAERIESLQTARLKKLVSDLESSHPFWQRYLNEHGVTSVSILSPDVIKKLPILDKIKLKQIQEVASHSSEKLSEVHSLNTSGTTGVPISVLVEDGEILVNVWTSFFRYLSLPEYEIKSLLKRKFIFVLGRNILPQYVSFAERFALDGFTSIFQRGTREDIYAKILKMAPVFLRGYSSVIFGFAKYVAKDKVNFPVFATNLSGEGLSFEENHFVKEVFGAPIVQRYNCKEAGMIGTECSDHLGRSLYHIHRERIILEVLDENGVAVSRGEEGNIVLTVLDRVTTPLFRYAIGDRGRLMLGFCSCGRKAPLLEVKGRVKDLIFLPSGRTFSSILFRSIFITDAELQNRVRQFQIVQEDVSRLKVYIVPYKKLNKSEENMIRLLLSRTLDDEIDVFIEQVPEIAPSSSGKSNAFVGCQN
jgi:phenylacetate-CoA ligase